MDKETKKPSGNSNASVSQVKLSSIVRDVYDAISFGKRVYSNRAVISRRISVLSITVGFIFTLLYIAYILLSGLAAKLSVSFEVVTIVLISAYAVVLIACLVISLCTPNVKTKKAKFIGTLLKIFRYAAKILSLAISIACLVLSINAGSESAAGIAFDTVMIIISVLVAVLQGVLLLSGGIGGFIRMLISPVNRKVKFSVVAMEWFGLITADEKAKGVAGKVSKKYLDEIGEVLDVAVIPALGKKHIRNITADDLTLVLAGLSPELLPVGEGAMKNLFGYACECGYIIENPCDSLELEGKVEEEESGKDKITKKIKGTITGKIGGFIAGIGQSALDNMLSDDDK